MGGRYLVRLTALVLLLAGCGSYQPRAHLTPGPETLPLTLYVAPFTDLSPREEDSDAAGPRLSLTQEIKAEGGLAEYLRRAVMVEFTSSKLFRSLTVDQSRADVTISGIIHAFYGATRHRSWVRFPGGRLLARSFDAGLEGWEGAIDLELHLSGRSGRQVGTYRGQRRYTETAAGYSPPRTPSLSPAERRFDEAFTESLGEIRDQILRDRDRILTALNPLTDLPTESPSGHRSPSAGRPRLP